ncbi:MAG: class I SAM-dependent methyltransferase [Betaproteobacteria bacterium]|nr:class I SAM-dependent methyltransferase [Betaproteobacteria bacterium]
MRNTRSFAALFGLVAALLFPAYAQTPAQGEHGFQGAEKWAKIFDDPARDEWQKPGEVTRALALAPGAAVADIGAGTGYFAVRLARALPKGRVTGVDTEPDMVRYLNERAKREGLANLSAQLGAADGPRLAAPVDLVIVVDTYHHIPQRERYFTRLRDALKPGGRIAIIDFRANAPMGPPARFLVPPERVKQEFARAGYELAQEHVFLPYQYFLVFRPKAR